MAKISIAQNPTFSAAVQLPRVGGEAVAVQFQFRYLDRLALAELFDQWNSTRETLAARAAQPDTRWAEMTADEIAFQAEQLKAIVLGWELDDPFDDAALRELVQTCAGAPKAVIDAYQGAYSSARLGN
ncbi:phage tail assembly chaperone [Pseudomonas cremoricolorata]|uniref:Phage tail assembly chaperone n=1 Tax=Pseudomonas cremoricolorata TaxID=157783 RepID=A0A089WVY4_9PSED|nr:phage tail assembly chaperone [Pseudomonas cremoricolorata]AIR90757.1 hypothetical protein LK03_16430 [Pseudomonas cremoricolorata]